jgi:hypothetical protein
MPMSYQSIYDTINPEGDYNIFPYGEILNNWNITKKDKFREYKTIKKPTYVIYGELDEFCYGKTKEFVEISGKYFLKYFGADHGFSVKKTF